MRNIAMEEETNGHPPELVPEPHPRIILILQLEYGAVPGQLVLERLCVAIDQQNYEANDED